MLAVSLRPDTERRLADLADTRGQSQADVARDLIEVALEDLADVEMAVGRLQTRRPALSSSEARAELGLDD